MSEPRASVFAWLAEYAMFCVLVLLGLGFSLATISSQQPAGMEAARQIESQLSDADWAKALICAGDGESEDAFVDGLVSSMRLRLADADPKSRVARGSPQVARRAIESLRSLGDKDIILLVSPDATQWKLFEDVESKFPGTEFQMVYAKPSSWPNFLKRDNLINVVNQIVVIAIIAIGMTLVILTGGIDLSVGSLIALSAVVSTRLIRDVFGGESAGVLGMVLASVAAVAVCGMYGLFCGLLIVRANVPPFIVTLGAMLIASGQSFILSRGQSIDAVPGSFVWLGRGTWVGIPVAVWIMVMLYAVAHLVMSRTIYGRWIYAVGGNRDAAKLCGIRVEPLIVSTYVISALLAGLGGLIMASRLKSGAATYGNMYEMYVIAAVVVGGTSLRGGYGTMIGTIVGALIIAVIENGMNLVHIESYTQKVVFGAVILIAVLLDRRSRRR